jgi:Uri superfamily endonuclease
METKVCSKCKEEKNVCNFGNSKLSKDGLLYSCKECNNKRSVSYRKNNPEKVLELTRNWTKKNPEWVYNRHKKWREENPNKSKELTKNWLDNNPEKRKEYRKNYKLRKHEQRKERRNSDPIFNLINRVRCRIWKYTKLMSITKKNKTFDIVGCSPESLKEHLEKQFTNGMTWDNRSEWHIDHIIPLSSAKTEEELYKLCHYSNLQPLWAGDNLSKGNKVFTN